MHETRKMQAIRGKRGDFIHYLKGSGLDVGYGDDPLEIEEGEVVVVDRDWERLQCFSDGLYDFVYSSHCLEHLRDIDLALRNWSRVLKSGGHLYLVLPDWVLYEKRKWPSAFNSDHKHTFSLEETRARTGRENHWNIRGDLEPLLVRNGLELLKAEREDYGYDYSKPELDQTFAMDCAVSQICLVARKTAASATRAMGYVAFVGGLGDIIHQIFATPAYRILEQVTERTMVLLVTHNPHAAEIFQYHPRKNLLDVRLTPWVPPGEMEAKIWGPLRKKGYVRLDSHGFIHRPVNLYPFPEDGPLLSRLAGEPYAVVQPFAGLKKRDLPADIVKAGIRHLIRKHGMKAVLIGKAYRRAGHSDEKGDGFLVDNRVTDMMNKLSVPGTLEAVRGCSLFFGSHSSMIIAAWHYRKPCVILYDPETRDRHFLTTDLWSFGKDNPETAHGIYAAYSPEMIDRVMTAATDGIGAVRYWKE